MSLVFIKRFLSKAEFKIASFYILISGIYIYISDNILPAHLEGTDALIRYQTYKGWGFVLVSGLLLYFLIRKYKAYQSKYETRREQLETHFRAVAEHGRDIVYRYTFQPEEEIEYISPAVEKITGRPQGYFYEDPAHFRKDLFPWDKQRFNHLLENPQQFSNTLTHQWKDSIGKVLWFEHRITPLYDESGDLTAIEGIAREVTREMEQRQQLEFHSEILRNIHDAVVGTDKNLRISYWNAGAERLYGYAKNEIFGKHVSILYDEVNKSNLEDIKQTVTQDNKYRQTRKAKRKDGEIIWLDQVITEQNDDLGNRTGFLSVSKDITEQHENEEELRENLALFSTLIGNLSVGVVVEDDSRNIIHANRVFCDYLGFENPGELIGENGPDLIARIKTLLKDPEEFEKEIEARIENKTRTIGEEISLEDGRFFERDFIPIQIESQQRGNLWLYRDVTKRKKMEARLRESNNLYERTLSALEEAVFVVDSKTRKVISCNQAVEQIFGYLQDEITGHTTEQLYCNLEDYQKFGKWSESVLEEDSVFHGEYQMCNRDGDEIITNHTISWLSEDEPPDGKVVSVVRDISERKKHEEALRESERQFREIFENIQEGFYRITPEGKFLLVNPRFAEILGYEDPETFTGMRVEDCPCFDIYPRDKYQRLLEEHGKITGFESTWMRKDGIEITVRENAHTVETEEGEILFYEGTVTDVTEQKKLEEQLIHSQKMESMGQIAGGISHDFNNILATLSGALQMLQLKIEAENSTEKYFEMMEAALARGETITDRLLTFTRSDKPKVQPVSLQSFLYSIKQIARHTLPTDTKIKVEGYQGNDLVAVEKNQLQQVLLNMCINASHAMNSGGTIALGIRRANPEEINTHIKEPAQEYLCVEVVDEGHGMSEETQEKIFEPFFTTKEHGNGTGLGLAVAYKIVKNHDGWIDVESSPGKGTTFTIGLPVTTDLVESEIPADIPPDFTGDGEFIFIIEDEEPIRIILTERLKSSDYRVESVETGDDGIRYFREHVDGIDAVITDLGLPDMSGMEVATILHSVDPEMPIIGITGYVDKENYLSLQEAGFREIIKKPFELKEVLTKIKEVLRGQR
ncbi:MAG: PAS domain S-box protein [Candidatus Marinimicrobia bacterium]|nr:PAS domain S-box protein [Candidatus Neomarinimicrobiota bacterium]MCF7828212.1 PAS domain S-box protein [Candidatus Neomarinimicrobiota bacterium]MCF7879613.1 PAS domain S-box protein [Candidatus Neomarinimicrobiota bacterium]